MKLFRQSFQILALCGILVWLLADSIRLRTATSAALTLCVRTVIPALFPFMIASSLLISLGFGAWAAPLFSRVMMPLFGLPGQAGSAFFLGLVAGYPIGARTAADLYQQGMLTQDEAQRLLCFCNNSNPVFLISVLGISVFNSVRIGLWLWLIHLSSALLVGLLFRRKTVTPRRWNSVPSSVSSFPSAFVAAVRSSFTNILSVCAFVTVFYVLAVPFGALPQPFGPFLVGSLELFSLTPLISANATDFVLASICSGWGSISVLCQTAAILDGTGLSPRSCVIGKLLQALFSGLFAALLIPFVFA